MKLLEVDINRAEGLRLCEELNLNGFILPKNHILSQDDISRLKIIGRTVITAAQPETGDIDFDTALGMAAAKICGHNLGFRTDERGFCEIAAVKNGFFDALPERISKFNRFSPYFILNTIASFAPVKNGDIVARLEILPPIIAQDAVDELVFSLSGNEALLNVRQAQKQNAALLCTRFYHNDDEEGHIRETIGKLTGDYAALNLNFGSESYIDHTGNDVADALQSLLKSPTDIIFVIPALRGNSDNDVVFSAIRSIADEIVCRQIPLLGGSDLIIAVKKNKKIISLPYNYVYLDSPLIDDFIKPAVYKEKLNAFDFRRSVNAVIGDISRIKDTGQLIRDGNTAGKNQAAVAAIVLAAGQSKRIGKNKLLADVGGEPLALKAIRAAIVSKASPVFVVTGYQAEALEAELENLDINIVYNPNYRTGIKTSIDIGLKSVPDFCEGALLLPADMPNITPEFINKMIAKFKKKQEKQLVIAEKNGIKSNPVIWSKNLYDKADLVAENADVRPVFMEHSDYTTLVKAAENELLDVNFQSDLDSVLNAFKA